MEAEKIYIFDTTLRDGGQTSGVSFTVEDKLKILTKLVDFGVDYIEAGWPGANSVDTNLFQELKNIDTKKTKISAFGMTNRHGNKAQNDDGLRALVESGAKCITIVGKTWDFHVTNALNIELDDNLKLIADSVQYLKSQVNEVIFDAEHFFDGYKANAEYSLKCLQTAHNAGANWVALCDTNGGTLPFEIETIITEIKTKFPKINLGIHCHNDTECAVANSIMAVKSGARMIQGTLNGLGERCGNANLISILPTLLLKMGFSCNITGEKLKDITGISRFMDSVLNKDHHKYAPYVGESAFAHKGGLHASAVLKNPKLYEHIAPELVGNENKVLVSNQSGKANIVSMLSDVGLDNDPKYSDKIFIEKLTETVKKMEIYGYSFEGADASFELLARKLSTGSSSNHAQVSNEFFTVPSYKVMTDRKIEKDGSTCTTSEAIVRVMLDGQMELHVSEGDGPVSAIDNALNIVLKTRFPILENIKLSDFKVRIVSHGFAGTNSITRVNVEYTDIQTKKSWSTVGVSENIINASFEAIYDAVNWYLMKNMK